MAKTIKYNFALFFFCFLQFLQFLQFSFFNNIVNNKIMEMETFFMIRNPECVVELSTIISKFLIGHYGDEYSLNYNKSHLDLFKKNCDAKLILRPEITKIVFDYVDSDMFQFYSNKKIKLPSSLVKLVFDYSGSCDLLKHYTDSIYPAVQGLYSHGLSSIYCEFEGIKIHLTLESLNPQYPMKIIGSIEFIINSDHYLYLLMQYTKYIQFQNYSELRKRNFKHNTFQKLTME